MPPSISVIAAVRDRIDLLRRMLESLHSTADQPTQIEVVLRCDFDDAPMVTYLQGRAGPRFIVGPRASGYASLPAFANEAARLSQADLVLLVNDDAEFQTKGWETRLLAHAAKYSDGIFDLGVETFNAGNFVFPCVSRRQIDLLGGIVDDRLIYPDIWLRDVLQPFGRAIRVHDVTIRHDWRGMSADQQGAARVAASPAHQALYAQCVEEGRAKIRRALEVAA